MAKLESLVMSYRFYITSNSQQSKVGSFLGSGAGVGFGFADGNTFGCDAIEDIRSYKKCTEQSNFLPLAGVHTLGIVNEHLSFNPFTSKTAGGEDWSGGTRSRHILGG